MIQIGRFMALFFTVIGLRLIKQTAFFPCALRHVTVTACFSISSTSSKEACMSLRRFRVLIAYAGIEYVEKTAPMFNMPAALDD